ncbi:MAG TPA: response regulator [Anaeromyxobacteraceae bacterium]|nr:response regulator [Anaeromyxobacteraceae bacterium]
MQKRAELPGRVLVIDDEPAVQDLLERVLANAGHQVSVVDSAEAALIRLARDRYDVIVVDNNLPRMTGLELMALVREHHPELRAIMITAYNTPAVEARARALGVMAYVAKPFGIVTIVGAIDDAIRDSRRRQ